MTGFVAHLLQRSLTSSVDVGIRPVSSSEIRQPSPALETTPQTVVLEIERDSGTDIQDRTDRRLVSAPEPVLRSAVSAATVALSKDLEGRPVPETTRRSDSPSTPRGESDRGPSQEGAESKPRADSAPRGVVIENHLQVHAAQLTGSTTTRFGEEQTPPPSAAERDGRGVRASERLTVREKPPGSQRLPGKAPVHADMEPDPLEPTAASRAHRRSVHGKVATQPDSRLSEVRPPTRVLVQERSAMSPVDSGRTMRWKSPDRKGAGEPELESIALSRQSARNILRKELPAQAQAVLVRPPQPAPAVQPAEQPVSKLAEPTVHVTIGRVEIRAVSAPVTPKRVAPTKPALSLSDYLQRRSGGRG